MEDGVGGEEGAERVWARGRKVKSDKEPGLPRERIKN